MIILLSAIILNVHVCRKCFHSIMIIILAVTVSYHWNDHVSNNHFGSNCVL